MHKIKIIREKNRTSFKVAETTEVIDECLLNKETFVSNMVNFVGISADVTTTEPKALGVTSLKHIR